MQCSKNRFNTVLRLCNDHISFHLFKVLNNVIGYGTFFILFLETAESSSGKKTMKMFYLTTHSAHFVHNYIVSGHMVMDHSVRKETSATTS